MRRELSATVVLALPLAAQQLGFQLMGSVDAALLGHYDDVGLAASGVGNNLLFTITCIGMGVVMGMDTVVPQALGAGRLEDARRSVNAGLRLAILVGMACTLAVLAMPLLLGVVGVDAEVRRQAALYVDLRAIGIVPFLVSVALRSYLAAHGRTRPLVIAVIASNIANALLDLLLIFVCDLGVAGAAIATVTVQGLTLFLYFSATTALDAHVPRPPSTRADLTAIVRYGAPVGGQMFAEVGIFGVATVLAAHLGKVPAAAHAIALNLASFSFSAAVGIGSATSVRVGHAIGAGDPALARTRGRAGLVVGLIAMGSFAITFVAIPDLLARSFSTDASIIAATAPLLTIAALFQLFDGTQAIAAGALRGLGDTRATFVGNLIGHYGIGLPIQLALCFGATLGVIGLWWGLSAGLVGTAIYLVVRFDLNTRTPTRSSR